MNADPLRSSVSRRRSPVPSTLAVGLWTLTVIGGIAAVALERTIPPILAVVPGWGTVGMLLALRRRTNPIGWALLATALVPAASVLLPLPIELQTGLVGVGVAIVLVLFPTGSVPGRSWNGAIALLVLGATAQPLLGIVEIGSFELPVGVAIAGAALVWCAMAPVVRHRHAPPQERVQIRWLGFVAVTAGAAVGVTAVGLVGKVDALIGLGGLLVLLVLLFGIPGAILVAVLRYRLYEIDRLISRSVTFTAVAALVSAVYAIPTAAVSRIFGGGNQFVTAGATLAAAAAVAPLRRRVHRSVERRFNRTVFDAAREVDRVAALVRDEADPTMVTGLLAAVVVHTLQPHGLSIWLARRGQVSPAG